MVITMKIDIQTKHKSCSLLSTPTTLRSRIEIGQKRARSLNWGKNVFKRFGIICLCAATGVSLNGVPYAAVGCRDPRRKVIGRPTLSFCSRRIELGKIYRSVKHL